MSDVGDPFPAVVRTAIKYVIPIDFEKRSRIRSGSHGMPRGQGSFGTMNENRYPLGDQKASGKTDIVDKREVHQAFSTEDASASRALETPPGRLSGASGAERALSSLLIRLHVLGSLTIREREDPSYFMRVGVWRIKVLQ